MSFPTRLFYTALCCLMAGSTAFAQLKEERAIRRVLEAQVKAWNAGNITAYMAAGYWNSDSLVFIGKSGPKYGYATTLANYQKSYPDSATMGKLSFDIISLQKLSPVHYFAIGKWALKRNAGDAGGSWTLLFRRIGGHWKIVVDHSS